jgi:hypothetical protein
LKESWFVHVTFVPTFTASLVGLNVKFWMVTALPLAAAVVAVVVAVVAAVVVGVAALSFDDEPQPVRPNDRTVASAVAPMVMDRSCVRITLYSALSLRRMTVAVELF